jgi:hypothetical protein
MFDIPSLLPGEFARGYLNAILRFNRPEPPHCRISEMHRHWKLDGDSVAALASLASVAPRHLLSNHTLEYFLRWPINYRGRRAKVVTDTRYEAASQWHQAARRDAFMCPCCIDSDLEHYGRSFWRVAHQLTGVYECPTHPGTILRASARAIHSDFWHTPGQVLGKSHSDSEWARWVTNDIVRRYADIVAYMANWEGDLNRFDLIDFLRQRLFSLNLDPFRLTEHLMARVPQGWLEAVVTPAKATDVPLRQCFLSLLHTNVATINPRRVFAYVAVAALWPTASEGIAALIALNAATED